MRNAMRNAMRVTRSAHWRRVSPSDGARQQGERHVTEVCATRAN
ncbi:MAG: hypothetical protein ABI601_06545 [bacterium]